MVGGHLEGHLVRIFARHQGTHGDKNNGYQLGNVWTLTWVVI